MAKTQKRKRPAFALTLAAQKHGKQALILRALGQSAPSNATGSLLAGLPARLPAASPATAGRDLGVPLGLREVAELIGLSPWTVRQVLLKKGLPHFRSGASGKLIFYRDQVIRWITKSQEE
jgi:hypothetical protein